MNVAKQIEELQVNLIPFANQRLVRLDSRDIETGSTYVGAVDLAKVVGTEHPDYADKTWGELKPLNGTLTGDITDIAIAYQPLKRAVSNLRCLAENPNYYDDPAAKEHWSFYLIDGNYYIAEGNNRSIIGRYYFYVSNKPAIVHGVTIHEAKWKPKPEMAVESSRSRLSQIWSRLFS